MASSVNCGYAWMQDGGTYDGLLTRVNLIAAMFLQAGGAVNPGVLPSGNAMKVAAGSGMTVTVATGSVVCPAAGSDQGAYVFSLLGTGTLTVETSDPANPRVDLVCANVVDPGTSAGEAEVQITAGTPTPGATLANLDGAPAAPSNSAVLAYVLVPASSASVTSGNIANVALFTVAQGGILPVAAADAPAGYTGALIYDTTSGSFKHNPAAGPAQAHVLPWAPQVAKLASNTDVNETSTVTLCSVTITTDGVTDIECTYKWTGITQATPTDSEINMELFIDATQVDAVGLATNGGATGQAQQGGSVTYRTSSVFGTTPAAGTHTIAFKAQNFSGGGNVITVAASPTYPAYLYVKPVSL